MLALRSRGLGTAWTTLHLARRGREVGRRVLGIPFDEYRQGGLFPIAYTKGTDFKRAKRLPAEQFTHWNSWSRSHHTRAVEPVLPPRLVDGDRGGVGQVQ